MGSCIHLRNSTLIALSLARMRFLIVLRPMTNDLHLRDRVQKWVKPKKSNVSGFPSPSLARCLAAWRPKRISRVLSGCNANSNARSLSCEAWRGKARNFRLSRLHTLLHAITQVGLVCHRAQDDQEAHASQAQGHQGGVAQTNAQPHCEDWKLGE